MRPFFRVGKIVLCGVMLACALQAELTSWGTYIPRRPLPPVVFITGHDSICPDARSGELPFFNLTFGNFDKVVNESGRVAMVFEMCHVPNRPGLETIATQFGELAGKLLYEDGQPVREIDVVAHNIGGLMIRSYLAQGLRGPRIRKVVFIGVPHFGTNVATFGDLDPQLRQVSPGNRWLFELATWNQGKDDLRGAEAIALAGTAGVNNHYGLTDSVVTVNSASLDFVASGWTVVLPLCHTQGGIGQLFLCNGAAGIANVREANHPTARITLAFLNGSGEEWRRAAEAAGSSTRRSETAGLMVQKKTAENSHAPIQSATLVAADGRSMNLALSSEGIAFVPNAPAGASRLIIDGQEVRLDLRAGASQAVTLKPGPSITGVDPMPGASWPLVLAPGMLVRIHGRELTDAGGVDVRLGGEMVRVLTTTEDGSLVAVLPDLVPGVVDLTIRNSRGRHTVDVVLEAAAPALLRTETGTAAVQFGAVVTLYLTGLGSVQPEGAFLVHREQPQVRIGGQPCAILFSGRASMQGVDQINCLLPAVLTAGPADVQVWSAGRSASGSLLVR